MKAYARIQTFPGKIPVDLLTFDKRKTAGAMGNSSKLPER